MYIYICIDIYILYMYIIYIIYIYIYTVISVLLLGSWNNPLDFKTIRCSKQKIYYRKTMRPFTKTLNFSRNVGIICTRFCRVSSFLFSF